MRLQIMLIVLASALSGNLAAPTSTREHLSNALSALHLREWIYGIGHDSGRDIPHVTQARGIIPPAGAGDAKKRALEPGVVEEDCSDGGVGNIGNPNGGVGNIGNPNGGGTPTSPVTPHTSKPTKSDDDSTLDSFASLFDGGGGTDDGTTDDDGTAALAETDDESNADLN